MGQLLKLKNAHSSAPFVYFSLITSVPFRSMSVQLPNLALIETKRIAVICFISISAKFGIYTVVGLNKTPVEDKICTFKCTIWVF